MVVSKERHRCSVKHEFQDKKYNGGRVMNKRNNKSSKDYTVATCTVCGLEDKI